MTFAHTEAAAAKVLAMLSRAAETRQAAPTNDEIADRIGARSTSSASRIITLLERRGLIAVSRFQTGREITIADTGARTAFSGERRPHSHAGARRARSATMLTHPRADAPAPVLVRVDRDPCFRCGTRRDVGCHHHPKGE